jgi:hypothetical protein
MSNKRTFIPRDKPRFWVVCVLAWLSGIAVGLIGFVATLYELPWLALPMMVLFVCCWLVGAVSWLGYIVGLLSGRYRNLITRPWSEQTW